MVILHAGTNIILSNQKLLDQIKKGYLKRVTKLNVVMMIIVSCFFGIVYRQKVISVGTTARDCHHCKP